MGLQEERIVVVTGASRGAGRGIAIALGATGATVYVTGRTRQEGDAPLPRLAPEYTGDLAAFSRGYFRELFARLGSHFVLVFDNYQEVPPHSRFHEVMREGLAEVPAGN